MTTTAQIVLVILLLYAGAMLLIGRLAARYSRSFQDVISASGEGTTLMLAGNVIAGQIGSGFIVGGAEYGALYGVGGAWYGLACAGTGLVMAALSRFIYNHRYVSLSDYYASRYGGMPIRLIYSVTTIISGISLFSGQLLAAKSVLATLGLPIKFGVVVIALVGLVYANAAGMWGTMKVSFIQSVAIFAGMISALAVMTCTVGVDTLWESLPAEYFRPVPFSGEFMVSITVPILLASVVSQSSFQGGVSARTAGTARNGYLIAAAVLVPVALIPPILGMFGQALYPNLPEKQVFTALLLDRLPVVVAAAILAAILFAVLLSCSSVYLMIATNFVHDIYKGMIAPEADDSVCRWMMLAVDGMTCVGGVILALRMDDIIQLLSVGYSLIAAGCLVPFLGGIVWKRGNTCGALVAACTGMCASLAASLGIISLPYASITSVLLAAAAYAAGSLLTKN